MPTGAPKLFVDERPWGEEIWVTKSAPSMVKIITVKPGEILSLQYHKNRDEFWRVISGDGYAYVGDEKTPIKTGSECFVERGVKHRIEGGKEVLNILELAFGEFDEKDIIRLEDRYGRV